MYYKTLFVINPPAAAFPIFPPFIRIAAEFTLKSFFFFNFQSFEFFKESTYQSVMESAIGLCFLLFYQDNTTLEMMIFIIQFWYLLFPK